ncbi:MAG: hypothetical protein LBN05_04575 [Oscillospiraceae bacterium]|jgi:hypothetical protein|nr:hypothetical protein [Oscillospiraceae bacterium]
MKRLVALISVICLLVVLASCGKKEAYDPNYMQYNSPFGENGVQVPYTEPNTTGDTAPVTEAQNADEGNYAPPGVYNETPGGYTPAAGGDVANVANGNQSSGGGGTATTTRRAASGGGSAIPSTKPGGYGALPSANYKPPATTKPITTTKSSGSGLGDIATAVNGPTKAVTDIINSFKSLGSGNKKVPGDNGNSVIVTPAGAIEVHLTLQEQMDIYNAAVAKATLEKPSMQRSNATKVSFNSASSILEGAFRIAVLPMVNEEFANDTQGIVWWPEEGSVDDNLFGQVLTEANVRGVYKAPKQAGDLLALDFGVQDPNVKMPSDSDLSMDKMLKLAADFLKTDTSTITVNVEWARVFAVIDRNTLRINGLEHNFLLTIARQKSTESVPDKVTVLLQQGYIKFKY